MSNTDKRGGERTEPILRLEGITKSFGAVEALRGVDFEVRAGEVVGLVGDNGAGKSTLVKTIAGSHAPDAGKIYFEGRGVQIKGPEDATELGIATVYQDLALCDNLDVVENLYLGRENLGGGISKPFRWLHEPSMERKSRELLDSLAVKTLRSVRSPVASLSGGQRQSIAIARSLLGEPKVVQLDEPTAALGVAQTEQVLALIKRLRERGLGVIVISHNLADVFEVTDRIAVLRLGQLVREFDVREARQDEVVAAITGAQFGDAGDNSGSGTKESTV